MDFWSQFWPQLIATLIGVGFGIPAGVWLNHLIERRTQKRKVQKIKDLVVAELSTNTQYLIEWKDNKNKGDIESGTLANHLHVETWRAFSEGGELEWIEDFRLRDSLSSAYHHTRIVQDYSRKYYDLTITRGSSRHVTHAINILERLETAVDNAIESIRDVRQNLLD
jgi:hypothetical protein